MKPDSKRWSSEWLGDGFGEVNENNRLHGRGIDIVNIGIIHIGYYENGYDGTGNYIHIDNDG